MQKATKFRCAYHCDSIEEDGFGDLLWYLARAAKKVSDEHLREIVADFTKEVEVLCDKFTAATAQWRVTDDDVKLDDKYYRE